MRYLIYLTFRKIYYNLYSTVGKCYSSIQRYLIYLLYDIYIIIGGRKQRIYKSLKNIGRQKFDGSSTDTGRVYHELPFWDLTICVHRKNIDKRLLIIKSAININNKYGVDLGCSVGGFTFNLQLYGAYMLGIDYDKSAIEVALACEDYYNTGAKFLQEDISLEIINKLCEIHTNPKTKQIDFTIWFSQFMWMVKRHGIEIALNALFFLSKISYELLFETSLGDADAGEEMLAVGISNEESLQRMLINNSCYSDIINLGFADDGWHKRPIFHCRNSQWKWEGTTSIVERIERNKVRKTVFDRRSGYEGLLRCKEYEITALKSLNNKHFPKLLEIGDNWFDMEYCGEKLNEQNLPKDWDVQIDEILNELNKANIIHRDIRPHNLMIINSVIKLIDFGWAVSYLHANSDIPKYLGDRWKCPDGFNDKYSIYKSIQSIITNSVIL